MAAASVSGRLENFQHVAQLHARQVERRRTGGRGDIVQRGFVGAAGFDLVGCAVAGDLHGGHTAIVAGWRSEEYPEIVQVSSPWVRLASCKKTNRPHRLPQRDFLFCRLI